MISMLVKRMLIEFRIICLIKMKGFFSCFVFNVFFYIFFIVFFFWGGGGGGGLGRGGGLFSLKYMK